MNSGGVTGTVCFCDEDLCNAAAQTTAGRIISFLLIGVVALAATRFLNQ